MADEPGADAPEGAAVFPLIPAELGVHPLLLGVLHAYVFLEGSEPTVLHPSAAEEAMERGDAARLEEILRPSART